jgi:flavin-dependent dehydrogenase
MRVMLADRLALPRDVICGGILKQWVLERIPLALPEDLFSSPREIQWSILDWKLRTASILSDTTYLNVNRAVFDSWLLQGAAARDGVDLWPRTRFLGAETLAGGALELWLDHEGGMMRVRCRFLLGCDGARSSVRRWLGAKMPSFWMTAQQTFSSEGRDVDRFLAFVGDEIDYYGWVIPKDGRLLAGLGCHGGRSAARTELRRFLQVLREHHGIHGSPLGRPRARPATRLRSLRELVPGRGNVLLAGEAAGLICPWSGEGMSHAVVSGEAAAESLGCTVPLRRYRRFFRSRIPEALFDLAGYHTMRRSWARRMLAAAVPRARVAPLDAGDGSILP